MNTEHFRFWPARLPKTLTLPETTINYYGGTLTYRSLTDEVERLAGYLENELGVEPNDTLLLYMQNSPQFVISFFAILRLWATVVPANPMSTTEDLAFYVKDCDIRHVLTGEELYSKAVPLKESTSVDDIIVASYADYIDREKAPADIPDAVLGTGKPFTEGIPWEKALANTKDPSPYNGTGADVAMIPYTSGTTGLPKGCVHTNDTVQANTYGASAWMSMVADTVTLTTLPLFHVTGLVHSALAPIASGSTMIMLTRWDRDYAAKAIEAYGCTHWINISTMLIDFLANPALENYDISSLEVIGGGGAPLPAAVGEQLYERTGLRYVEGYGLSETISHTHFNPPDRPKMQCLGIPSFDVDARVIDVAIGEEVAGYEEGELVVNGPQVFKGYHNREEENEQSHIELDGKTFFRTGDIVKRDEEGYFFLVDRLKRMINASGFKVWPTEVESILYKHPSIHQACVVSEPDEKRGETVKAFVILNDQAEGDIKEEDIIEWSKNHMAAYKYPRIVEFRDSFPMTSSGKILWRKLQENE
ncbi:long-chain-fatty-acid--CoA ligase [Salimicrobium salexigens]|uniref:Fatty-acyl-CoA synthase n=1 Tax=Salimicrobium salexigens TaxID=908941 RepID=A0ABY1L064_9BACI|nr:long-chain-fatty-acid--CoA ligase [Salimicrobium salexigens]SIS97664.1 fatty-acyl-CoA synthase [Salimicrobium salexigens]